MSNPFQAGGATSRNALKKYLKADDDNNFETVMQEIQDLKKIFTNEMKNISQRLTEIETEVKKTQQLAVI
jgi:ABC-type enterochelin transport system substrate-binding protein